MNIVNMTDPMSANGEERVGSLSDGRIRIYVILEDINEITRNVIIVMAG